MYPTITDFLKKVFGINIPLPIQTYGFFFALALLTAAYLYYFEYKRKEKEGKMIPFYVNETIGEAPNAQFVIFNFIFSFLIGYKLIEALIHYKEFVANPQEMILSARGNFIGGLIFAIIVTVSAYWKKNEKKLPKPETVQKELYPHNIVGNMFIIVGVAGIAGAKIFDVLQPQNFKSFLENPISSLLSFSGLTFYGGIIGGFIAGIIFLKKYNINIIHSLDTLAPAAAIGYGIGRIGCQVSGDGCWGMANTAPKPHWLNIVPNWAWSYDYPNNVLHEVLKSPVFPTPFYETLMMLIIFGVLWAIRKKIQIPGLLFAIYLILSAVERFLIEFIRATHRYNLFGLQLSQAQIISIFLFAIGLALIVLMIVKKDKFYQWAKQEIKPINIKKDK